MLRRTGQYVDRDFVAERCKLSNTMAQQVIDELVNGGYLEFSERDHNVDYYKMTDKARKLAEASAVNKMPRAKAEQMIAALMRRVEEVNGNADYMYRVPTVIVYGSYVRGESYLSDVDIAVELKKKWKPQEEDEWAERRLEVARAKGRSFPLFMDELYWPEKEVKLHLKARTRGLSLHPLHDFIDMPKDGNFAYKVLLGDAAKIAEELARTSAESLARDS